ncbi:GntR family transcriptional regulator [Actinomadura sp. NBRC 104412]|uniref:GntR family transcriptional regulator n=1 Tax=unclassified Actinomadura TaxID=2626254 RepID=UPI002554EAEB|nr:GntR family transcriptional regulator [Actinomadura sp. NBRC 104412]
MAKRDEQLPSRRLAALLRAEIEHGDRYPAGSRLPGLRQLAADHSVALNTAATAVQLLAKEGLVEVRKASGAYVRDPSVRKASERDLRVELVKVRERIDQARSELASAEQAVQDLLDRLPPQDAAQ